MVAPYLGVGGAGEVEAVCLARRVEGGEIVDS